MTSRKRLLIEAVEHLAAEPAAQQAYLASLGVPDGIDELALEFDDIAAARDDMRESAELTPEEHRMLRLIDDLLKNMSQKANMDIWTPAALVASAHWAEVRMRSREFLHLLKHTEGSDP